MIVVQVDLLVFDRAPEPLDEDVIQGPAATVHPDLNASLFQDRSERQGRKLDALIGVENLGWSVARACCKAVRQK